MILCDSVISLLQLNNNGGFDEITSVSEGRDQRQVMLKSYTSLYFLGGGGGEITNNCLILCIELMRV